MKTTALCVALAASICVATAHLPGLTLRKNGMTLFFR